MHITIDNNTSWNLTTIKMLVNDHSVTAPIEYGYPLKPGTRWSFTSNRVQQYPPLIGTRLKTQVLSAEGHR